MNTSTAPVKKTVRKTSAAAPAPTAAPSAPPAPVAEAPKKVAKKAAPAPVVEAPVPTPSATVSRAGSPAKSVEAPKKATKKASTSSVETPAPSASVSRAGSPAKSVSAPAPAPIPTPTETTEVSLTDEVGKLQTQLNTMRDGVATALSQLKRVSRHAQQDIKDAGKRRRKQKTEGETSTAEGSATETDASLSDEVSKLQQQLAGMRDGAIAALSLLKTVSRRAQQDIKEASKRRRKQKTQTTEGGEKKPNNFQIPVPISAELAAFLGCSNTISRTDVNRRMQEFAKTNGLTKGQTIHLTPTDEMKADTNWKFNQTAANSLRKLLNLPDGETLTIFNIQKYLKAHYPKPTAAEKA